MKNYFRIMIATLLLLTMLPVSSFAAAKPVSSEHIIYLEDGSYITVELTQLDCRASGTKRGSKTYTHRSSSGEENWSAVLSGIFTYTGSSATCTAASCDVTITDTAWHVVSKTASPSGNSALGELTMGRKFLGITIDKETISMRITCDANGNLS